MAKKSKRLLATTILESILLVAALAVMILWLLGQPLFYSETRPVMSLFTALSLFIMAGSRLARRLLYGWPTALTLALLGIVIGGNMSSMLMQTGAADLLGKSFANIVFTSVMTSLGLILFCFYELLIVLRETPQSAFILDDILLHLALVPGGISLLGYLLANDAYLSTGNDARVGISLLEMCFMATYAVTAVLSNRLLFLWQFLAKSWANRFIFIAFFVNQFVAPLAVALLLVESSHQGVGIELFVMLAGVIATLSFLLLQAYGQRKSTA